MDEGGNSQRLRVWMGREAQLGFWSFPRPKNTTNPLNPIIASNQSSYFKQILKWQCLAFQEQEVTPDSLQIPAELSTDPRRMVAASQPCDWWLNTQVSVVSTVSYSEDISIEVWGLNGGKGLFPNKTELYGEGTLRSRRSHCVCLHLFKLSLSHLNIFPSECIIFITEFKIIYCLIWKIIQATMNRNFKMLSNISQSGENPTFCDFNSLNNILIKQSPSQKFCSAQAEYTPRSVSGRAGYANILYMKKASWKLQKGKQREPSKMKAAHISEETMDITSAETLRWHQETRCSVLIKVCFSELSSTARYSGESGPHANKVDRALKRTSKHT